MKLGLSMWSYVHPYKQGALDIPGFVREAARVGAEGVELLDFFWQDQDAELPGVRDALRETGLPVGVYSVANDFVVPGEAAHKAQVETITKGVDTAQALGARVVRVFGGNAQAGITDAEAFRCIVQGLSEGAAYARARGITLALENHGSLAGLSGQVALILDAVGSPALGANPDTGNFLLLHDTPENAVARLAPRAAMAHLKDFVSVPPNYEGLTYASPDGAKYAGTALGEGEVNIGACLDALHAAGFTGWVNLEYEGEEDPHAAVARSMAHARRLLPG